MTSRREFLSGIIGTLIVASVHTKPAKRYFESIEWSGLKPAINEPALVGHMTGQRNDGQFFYSEFRIPIKHVKALPLELIQEMTEHAHNGDPLMNFPESKMIQERIQKCSVSLNSYLDADCECRKPYCKIHKPDGVKV